MRRSVIRYAGSVLLALAFTAPSYAVTTDVLLPDSAKPSASPSPAIVPAPVDTSSESTTAPPAQPTGGYSMPPPVRTPQAMGQAPGLTSMGGQNAASLIMKTRIIKMPAMSDTRNTHRLSGSTPFTVTLQNDQPWLPSDARLVHQRLGIPENSVPSMCVVHYDGQIITNKGIYTMDFAGLPRSEGKYDGTITAVMVKKSALCNASQLPDNLGIVMQMGDKYFVSMGAMTCQPPQSSASLLAISNDGEHGTNCRYQ